MVNRPYQSMEMVFDCVVNYIHDANDRNSFSLVSHTCYDVDAKTRKHVTAHLCYATPLRCRQRFPFIKSLTLTGSPHIVNVTSSPCNWDHNVTPWIQEIATFFKRLKVVRFQNLVLHDSDLELLARTRGEKLKVLEIDSCSGFSTDGLLYIGKYCTGLRILSLENSSISEKDGEWLHELALCSSSIESLNFYRAGLTKFDVKDLALVAKNCSQSLVSVKISDRYDFIELVEFFSYALKLEDFGGGWFGDNNRVNPNIPFPVFGANPNIHFGMGGFGANPNIPIPAFGVNPNIPFPAQQAKYRDFKFPPKLKYLALNHTGRKHIVLPFAHLITQLDIQYVYDGYNYNHHYSLIENCPNLEVLYTTYIMDGGLEQLSKYCKNLRKLYVTRSRTGYVTEKGLLALAPGCPKLEWVWNIWKKNLVLDKGIRTLLIGCNKLERLSICFEELGGLSDESLKNIGMCGYNLRYLSLGYVGESDAGLVELSFGCPKLQNLVISDCPFSNEAFDIFRCNVPSLSQEDIYVADAYKDRLMDNVIIPL
ncbi:coronatine-insensitive protein 1 [Tanacetum coccineum]